MDNDVKQDFANECDELLERMEQVLLVMENEPDNPELVDELFRIVHTLKGSSGLFGFTSIVSFSHELENLAVQVRNGLINMTQPLCDIMLESRDHLLLLVDCALERPVDVEAQVMAEQKKVLFEKLKSFDPSDKSPGAIESNQDNVETGDIDSKVNVSDSYTITMNLNPDVLTFGTDPIPGIIMLQEVGDIVACEVDYSKLPSFVEADFETCYLSFKITLKTDKGVSAIEEALSFFMESGEILIEEQSSEHDSDQEVENNDSTSADPLSPEQNINLPASVSELKIDTKKKVNAELEKNQQQKASKTENESVRVDSGKLESLINLVGELVIANANTHLLAKNGQVDRLTDATEAMLTLVEDIRDTTLGLRMVPVGTVFNRFKRVVREVSQQLGKKIDLVITGGDTELDKSIVDKISDPLMHMIRNAIDHGLESTEQRIATGKPERGTVKLNAFHDSGVIVIEIVDDGKGIAKEKVLARALEKGIISDTQAIPDRNIFDLIFYPGFSTAEQVTNLSGRGVGMDVVKRNIDSLNGQIEVDSEPGSHTKFSIRLPLTLAIIDGFLFEVDGLFYVVPLDMVDECVEFNDHNDADYVDSQFINLRGEIMPYMRLKDFFDVQNPNLHEQTIQVDQDEKNNTESNDQEDHGIEKLNPSDRNGRESIIVIRSGNNKSGIVVDRLLGEYQTVIKPVGRVFKNLNWLTGATILGNGDVALIVDVLMLIKHLSTMNTGERPRLPSREVG